MTAFTTNVVFTRDSLGPGCVADEEVLVAGEQLDDGGAVTLRSTHLRRDVPGDGVRDVVQVCLQVHHSARERLVTPLVFLVETCIDVEVFADGLCR